MQKIRKAVIPAAGMGTRFLPATKAMAKETMPIVDTPVIQFIVDEVLASGIEEILIITGRNKRSIEDHFDANIELEDNLEAKGKTALLERVRQATISNIQFKRQHYPKGLGDAVLTAESFVGDEPFLLALGDDILSADANPSKALIEHAEAEGAMAVLTQTVPGERAAHYGIVESTDGRVTQLSEKPSATFDHDVQALCGRYVLTPGIFGVLRQAEAEHAEGTIELTDALDQLAQTEPITSLPFDGTWFEVGEPLGLVEADIQHALHHPEIADEFRAYLKNDVIPRLKQEQ